MMPADEGGEAVLAGLQIFRLDEQLAPLHRFANQSYLFRVCL